MKQKSELAKIFIRHLVMAALPQAKEAVCRNAAYAKINNNVQRFRGRQAILHAVGIGMTR
jgi:hypothetical protein